jgi:hypothetical protein
MISRRDLLVLNEPGFPPTFSNFGQPGRHPGDSFGVARVSDWRVSHDLMSSDHAEITYDIHQTGNTPWPLDSAGRKRYVWKNTNWKEFYKTLRGLVNENSIELSCPDVETCAKTLSGVLEAACEKHMKRTVVGRLKPSPWWSLDLSRKLTTLGRWKRRLRSEQNQFRRKALRRRYNREGVKTFVS